MGLRLTPTVATRAAYRAGAFAAALLATDPAAAQLQLAPPLPGSAEPAAPAAPVGAAKPKPPNKPVFVKTPGEEAVLGRLLSFEGAKGAMQFDRTGKEIVLSKLTLPGERLSKPAEACQVDIVGAQPIVASAAGYPEGALRWRVDVEACPFTVDVLDGAVLVSSAHPSCEFSAADCRVNPVGLWGPPAGSITATRVKELERERVQAETVMRTNFRVLLQRAGKDRGAVKALAGEQAAFSSQREMTCRDYARETVHGFCSAQITQARSLAILAKFPEEAKKATRTRASFGSGRAGARRPAKPVLPETTAPLAAEEKP